MKRAPKGETSGRDEQPWCCCGCGSTGDRRIGSSSGDHPNSIFNARLPRPVLLFPFFSRILTSSGLVQWSISLHVSPPSPSVTCAQDGTNAGSAGSQLTGHGDSPLIFLRLEATKVLFETLL